MAGFSKLHSSILTSSVWCEDMATRCVWIAMLAACDAGGIVEGSVPGFARIANVTEEDMARALDKFMAPDPHSRTTDYEGRRVEAVRGGWHILNYAFYREQLRGKPIPSADRQKQYRDRKRAAELGHEED
jgi:hypothetical protein